jgi:prepilin peptidase CpaA
MVLTLVCMAYPALLIYAALHDVATMTIPNWVSVSLGAAFIPAAVAMGLSPSDVGAHIAIAAIALLICVGLFSFNIIGGGDAKVIAATVLWVGASGLEDFLLITAVAGGALALILVFLRRSGLKSSRLWARRLLSPNEGAPYAVAIAIGALFAVPASPLLAEGLTRF